MIMLYVRMIEKGLISIEEVPELYRTDVEKYMNTEK